MIKELLCVLVLMLAGAAAQEHPGVGIVKDNRGNLSDVREEARASRQCLKHFTRIGGESCLRVLRYV